MQISVFSKKVTWFSFVFSLLVVWVHSYNAQLYLGGTKWLEPIGSLEYAVIDWLAQIAVPGFFMISGYLFYRNFSMDKLRTKWESRIRSVLVPYILWNFLYYIGYVIGSRLPWLHEVVGKGVIPFRLDVMVDAVINHTYNYVFWYLFQLIVLILLAPVLYPVLQNKKNRCGFFAILGILLFFDIHLPILNTDALFYYSAAASAAMTIPEWIEAEVAGEMTWRIGVISIFFGVIFYILGLQHRMPVGFVLCRFFAVTGLWLMVSGKTIPETKRFMDQNFFLYATHFGVVRFVNKALARVFAGSPAAAAVLFLAMPALTLGISTLMAGMMRCLMPRTWKILNGGR